MITFDEFIKKYLGKKIDYDGYYGGQCMDLYHQYVVEVLGLEHPPASGAYKLWSFNYKDYKKIKNTPNAIPQKGDIVIWNTRVGGGYGHVAVFVKGDVMQFTSLDQNWPTLSKVTLTQHNYSNIYGWLHPIRNNDDMTDNSPELKACLKAHSKLIDELTKVKQEFSEYKTTMQANIDELQNDRNAKVSELKQVKEELAGLRRELAGKLGTTQVNAQILSEVELIVATVDDAKKKLDDITNDKIVWDKQRIEMEGEIAKLKQQLKSHELKDQDFETIIKVLMSKILEWIKA